MNILPLPILVDTWLFHLTSDDPELEYLKLPLRRVACLQENKQGHATVD
jgi:hypothetical protein